MNDLYAGIVVVVLASIALFAAALRYGRPYVAVVACAAVVALGIYCVTTPRGLWLAAVLPFSNLIVVGNWHLPAVALLAGIFWRARRRSPAWLRAIVVLPLLGYFLFDVCRPLLGSPPPLQDEWLGGVCQQTSSQSCSAAAGATLLRAYGIGSSEREMADLCLTRPRGTMIAGLYRGLILKTEDTPYRVEVCRTNFAGLREVPAALLSLVPPEDTLLSWFSAARHGHSSVFLGCNTNGSVTLGDPQLGLVVMDAESFQQRWNGEIIRLVRRNSR